MFKPQQSLSIQWKLILLFSLTHLLHSSHGDVGTASYYDPPFFPTACYGDDSSQLPDNNMFGAAGEGIWDNEASCGREYLVSCLSAAKKGTCKGGSIKIKIVDRAATAVSKGSSPRTTIVLSPTAFASIANPSASRINIEYQQV
ncbi:EG45-like domain containing protein [Macadamia integrifolia]|uniref:EG45-like domain containing protein n=1 Tax=Macadamia integrifolia TaxID=60698 RepID=UPI001C501190|nr:EG45-like domain containing protein [Macadamia integrifolia]